VAGIALYATFMAAGAAALAYYFVVLPLGSSDPDAEYTSMGIGALCALPPLVLYLWVPRFIDRFDPEPWWALALALGWGAIAACGLACTINSNVETAIAAVGGKELGNVVGACLCAPFVEEALKGVAVFGVFYFLHREFDGVVDGVIYATFAALGFAAVENVLYYGRAVQEDPGGDALAVTFVIRGILSPWGHPLYTSMTGIGFGIARETNSGAGKWLGPIGGYLCAVLLHSIWNTSATISKFLFLLMLPLWLLFVAAFICILIWLVVRKGRIIRAHLQDEVLVGTMTREELMLVTSPFASWRATFEWGGAPGRRFVRAAARLGLSKWHAGRAMRGHRRTVSVDFIVPLRQELGQLRMEISRALGRPVPQPQAWRAPPAQMHDVPAPRPWPPPQGWQR
jgi:RsiW-degrading membrane proteinase PrsW (M82 family)